jgi:hypothetical protein
MSPTPPPEAPRRRWSAVDLGAGLAVLLAAVGLIWSPKLSMAVAKATGSVVPVRVQVDVRGVAVADPAALIQAARDEGKVQIVIRNQPHGTVRLSEVIPLQRRLVAVQPDSRVVTAPDPNQQVFGSLDARFVLTGQARRAGGGVVFGNQNLKIGAPIEIEGLRYRLNGVVSGLQVEPS